MLYELLKFITYSIIGFIVGIYLADFIDDKE